MTADRDALRETGANRESLGFLRSVYSNTLTSTLRASSKTDRKLLMNMFRVISEASETSFGQLLCMLSRQMVETRTGRTVRKRYSGRNDGSPIYTEGVGVTQEVCALK